MSSVIKKVPKLRFREFSGEWQEKKLGTVADVRDGTHESPKYVLEGKPLVTSKNLLKNGKLDLNNVDHISNKDFEDINKRSGVNIGDILFGMIGTLGNPVRVKSNDFAIKNVALIKQNGELLNSYLIQYLGSANIDKQFFQRNAGGTQKFMALGVIRDLTIRLPNKVEQKKIAGFLEVIDEKIGKLQKKNELLEKYKKGIMQKIFSQQIRFKDENGKSYPGWEEQRLDDVGNTYNGLQGKSADDFGEGKPFITYKQIFDNSRVDISKSGSVSVGDNEKQNRVRRGDAFFTTSSETPEEVGFASVLLDEVNNTYLNSFCFGFRMSEDFLPEFARFLFRSDDFRKSMVRLAQGSTRYNISKVGFLKTKILLPTKKEQQKIAEFLTSLDDKIKLEESRLEQAKQFKKALLQQMFV